MVKKKLKNILDNSNINEEFTTKPRQLKEKNKFINSIVPEKNWNLSGRSFAFTNDQSWF